MANFRFPVLFLGHGSPMNIVADNPFTQMLRNYSSAIPTPKAVVIVSAHWQTSGSYITSSENPEQIFDFYGFPPELYRVYYTPAGLSSLATHIHSAIPEIQVDSRRGIDHAGWTLMHLLYPKASVPQLQISLNVNLSPREHFELGRKLAFLRDEDVLVIGSGNLIHNLGLVDFDDSAKWNYPDISDTIKRPFH